MLPKYKCPVYQAFPRVSTAWGYGPAQQRNLIPPLISSLQLLRTEQQTYPPVLAPSCFFESSFIDNTAISLY